MITEKDLEEVKCSCGGWMKQTKVRLYGFPVRAWKCKKCGEIELDGLESDRARMLSKMRKEPLILTAGAMTDSIYIRFPKKFSGLIPAGTQVQITPKDEDELILKIGI